MNGNIVAQIGVEPVPASVPAGTEAGIIAGYSYVVELPAGLYVFAANVTASTVTLRADGANAMLVFAFMGIHPGKDSRGGYAYDSTLCSISTGITRQVQCSGKLAAGWYNVRVGFWIAMYYEGKSKPYVEAIGSVTTKPFTEGTAAPMGKHAEGPHDERFREALNRPIKLIHDGE